MCSTACAESTFRHWFPSLRRIAASPRLLSGLPFVGSFCSSYSHLEHQLFTSRVHLQRLALLEVPSQELLGQGILQAFLHSTAHRSNSVDWTGSLLNQKLQLGRIHVKTEVLGGFPSGYFCSLTI